MASVASQLIEGVAAHVQSDSLEDAREICADGTYFPNNVVHYLPFYYLFNVWRYVNWYELQKMPVSNLKFNSSFWDFTA